MNSVTVNGKEVVPSKIVCVGRNYVAHVEELGNELPDEMVIFLKPNSAIGDSLVAFREEPIHYEAEICFMVENGGLGAVGCGLDLTRRKLQGELKDKGLPWERSKAFDGAALFSSFVNYEEGTGILGIELEVDGELRQRGDTTMMLYPPARVIEKIREVMSLEDGDIIMTGTPGGVGEVRPGEVFHVRITADSGLLAEGQWLAV